MRSPFRRRSAFGGSSVGAITPSVYSQIIGLRAGTTPNGRTTTATPFVPTSGNLPTGMTWSVNGAGRVTITTTATFTGNIVNWNAAGMKLLVEKRRVPLIEQCLWAVIEIEDDDGGVVEVMRHNTLDGQGWDGFRPSGVLIGAALLTERNRFLGSYSDGINFQSGTTDPAGITFRWNYSRPGTNLPYNPLPWNPATSYVCTPPASIDFVTDGAGQIWVARVASLNQPPPVTGVSNTWWALWASSTRPTSLHPILYPHSDGYILKGSAGGGILIENNLIDWTRDKDGLLGYGPIVGNAGTNQGIRYDPGNSSTTAKRLSAIVIRSNVLERNSPQSNNNPFDFTHRSRPDNQGLVSIVDNWIAPNGAGRYSSSNNAIDTWTGNADLRTLASIPAPSGAMRGAPSYGTNKPVISSGAGTYPLLTASFPEVTGGALNTISYQWRRNGSPVGTNSRTYQTVDPTDAGANISVVMTGTNQHDSTVSGASDNFFTTAPFIVFTAPPVLSGSTQVGRTITWTTGTHSEVPTSIVSVVYADGAPIAGVPTSATSYVLTAAEDGKEIYVQVTITAANGTTAEAVTETSEPVLSVEPFIVVASGQSNWVYGGMGASSAFNGLTEAQIPDFTSSNVTFVASERYRTGSGFTTYVSWAVNKANAVADNISAGMVQLAQFLEYAMPSQKFVIVNTAVSGTGRAQIANDAAGLAGARTWEQFAGVIEHARTNYGEIDIVLEHWWQADVNDMDDFGNRWGNFYLGQEWGGGATALGFSTTGGSVVLEHMLWDITAPPGERGLGLFARDATKLVTIACRPKEPREKIQGVRNFAADSRVQSIMGHFAPPPMFGSWAGGHAENNDPDGLMYTMHSWAASIIKAAGYPLQYPEVESVFVPVGGAYADFIVTLPNGGNLTTIRALEGRAAPGSPAEHYQPNVSSKAGVMGVQVRRTDEAYASRFTVVPSTNVARDIKYRGSVVVEDAGTGVGPSRRGRIRVTPVTPFADGDILNYLTGHGHGTNTPTSEDVSSVTDKDWLNYAIETIPSLRDVTALYPWPGVPVSPSLVEYVLTASAAPANPIGTPTVLVNTAFPAQTPNHETTTFTPAGPNSALYVVATIGDSSATGGPPAINSATIGTAFRTPGTGTALTLVSDSRRNRARIVVYRVASPVAALQTVEIGYAASNPLNMRITVIEIPNGASSAPSTPRVFDSAIATTSVTHNLVVNSDYNGALYVHTKVDNTNTDAMTVSATGTTLYVGDNGTTSGNGANKIRIFWQPPSKSEVRSVQFTWTNSAANNQGVAIQIAPRS